MNASLTDTVNYSNGYWNIGSNTLSENNLTSCWGDWCNHWHYIYPTYITNTVYDKPNPTELAFKIVGKMLEKKLIERMTVKQFIETINEIAKLI